MRQDKFWLGVLEPALSALIVRLYKLLNGIIMQMTNFGDCRANGGDNDHVVVVLLQNSGFLG
jgi:hypothetical protein